MMQLARSLIALFWTQTSRRFRSTNIDAILSKFLLKVASARSSYIFQYKSLGFNFFSIEYTNIETWSSVLHDPITDDQTTHFYHSSRRNVLPSLPCLTMSPLDLFRTNHLYTSINPPLLIFKGILNFPCHSSVKEVQYSTNHKQRHHCVPDFRIPLGSLWAFIALHRPGECVSSNARSQIYDPACEIA